MLRGKRRNNSGHQGAKWVTALLLILILWLGTVAAFSQELGGITDATELRSKASSASQRLAKLEKGNRVVLLSLKGDWYFVSYGKQTGYVQTKYITPGNHSIVANAADIAALGDAPGPMKIGDVSDDVSKLQMALKILGYYNGRINGDYSHETTVAVLNCQKDNGLMTDGVAGIEIIGAIFGPAAVSGMTASTGKPKTTTSTSNSSTVSVSFSISDTSVFANAPRPTSLGSSAQPAPANDDSGLLPLVAGSAAPTIPNIE